jgi:hypothetical protein
MRDQDQGIAPSAHLQHAEQASTDRFAISQALREADLLLIQR